MLTEKAEQGRRLDSSDGRLLNSKARPVMKGFSEAGAEHIEARTPQVFFTRDAGIAWVADWSSRVLHSGGPIDRELYAELPVEGLREDIHDSFFAYARLASDSPMGLWHGAATSVGSWQQQAGITPWLRMTWYMEERLSTGQAWKTCESDSRCGSTLEQREVHRQGDHPEPNGSIPSSPNAVYPGEREGVPPFYSSMFP